jgi:Fe-S cluster assembly iron-binding protein IscA
MADHSGQDLNDPPITEERELIERLLRSRDAIRDGTALYNGLPIHEETVLTRYEWVVGAFVYARRGYSRYFIHEREDPGSVPRNYLLLSLLLGWWYVPWGPVWTLKAVVTNLGGGTRKRVIDLIGDETPHRNDVVVLTDRAVEAARREMSERGFPPGSALRVDVYGARRPRRYEVTYDEVPAVEGRDWVGRSQGIPILVFKKDAPRLKGLTVDYQDGQYTFDERTLTSPD